MTTNELFAKILKHKDFKRYPQHRVLKFRHKKGTLTDETYKKIFDFFGYTKKESWVKKPKVD